MEEVLENPEILRIIGGFLDERRLAAAVTVCKSWQNAFMPFLYRTYDSSHPQAEKLRDSIGDYHSGHVRVIKLHNSVPTYGFSDCNNVEELEISFGDDCRLDKNWVTTSWGEIFPLIVRANPKLHTVRLRGPTETFLRTVFTCCTQLKVLHIHEFAFKNIIMAELFYNTCLRLQDLMLRDTLLFSHSSNDISWPDWPRFHNIKTLWIGFTLQEGWVNGQQLTQLGFIERCPDLETLTWSILKSPVPVMEVKGVLRMVCPKIRDFGIHHPGFHPHMEDGTMADILKACDKPLTTLRCDRVTFGELSTEALIKGLASTLTRLDLHACGDSAPMIKILTSCPHLTYVKTQGVLDIRDLLGIKRPKTEKEEPWETEEDRERHRQRLMTPPSKLQPLPKTIRPPEWVCKNLRTLEIGIWGLVDKAPEWQRAVLNQIAKMKQLRVLNVGRTSFRFTRLSRDGLDLRLSKGLDILGSLTMLESLEFGDLWQEMSEQDVKWMFKAWPRFSHIRGWVHHTKDRRLELEKLFQERDISVGLVYDPEEYVAPAASDDDDDEEEEEEDEEEDQDGEGSYDDEDGEGSYDDEDREGSYDEDASDDDRSNSYARWRPPQTARRGGRSDSYDRPQTARRGGRSDSYDRPQTARRGGRSDRPQTARRGGRSDSYDRPQTARRGGFQRSDSYDQPHWQPRQTARRGRL
ncbi:hypothetical protein B0O80DRAFT_531524 [Mortierella sp. GBAus27b]|nr:hypothetical protein BGX31_009688 [Mortierella sp. GBA43]KAI8350109.1 hypothetical protein B0O80DRAFT_531524 [Mortierella sp. GBAus27b]